MISQIIISSSYSFMKEESQDSLMKNPIVKIAKDKIVNKAYGPKTREYD